MKRLILVVSKIFIYICMCNWLFIQYIIDAHKFFTRKSQHYIMSNWAFYENKDYRWNRFNKPQKATNYKYYKKHYLKAYIKFMYYSFNDAITLIKMKYALYENI